MRQYFITSLLIHIIALILFLLLSYLFVPKTYKYSLNVSVVSSNNLPINNALNKIPPKSKPEQKEVIEEQPIVAQPEVKNKPTEVVKKTNLPALSIKKAASTKNQPLIKDTSAFLTPEVTEQEIEKNMEEAQAEEVKNEQVKATETENTRASKEDIVKKNEPIIIKKDQSFTNLLSDTANSITTDETQDILSDSSPLNDGEKSDLVNQLNKCWINLGPIKDKTITIQLKLKMNSDATINNIEFIEDDSLNLTKEEIESLRVKIINLFKNPQCSKLALPDNKFALWQTFSIKLNIKGFFD